MGPARKEPDINTYSGRCAIRLRQLREKEGLSVEEVAAKCGVSSRTIYGWEAARTEPNLDLVPTLAVIYKLASPRALFAVK